MKEKSANGMKEWNRRAANIITLNQPVYFIFISRTTKGEKKVEEVRQQIVTCLGGLFHGMLWRAEPSSSIMKDLFKPHPPPHFDHQCFKSKDSLIYKYRVWGSYAWEIQFQERFRDGRPEAHDQEGHVIWCSLRSWALFSCEDPTLIQS